MKYLITGSAGFIGMHVAEALLKKNKNVLGVDNLNSYYDISLKKKRLDKLLKYKNFKFKKIDITNTNLIDNVFSKFKPTIVINLAAQAGVRYSLKKPHEYINTNIKGFLNILEASKKHRIKHLVYASTSSVYGANTNLPHKESNPVDHPLSLYAATKRSNELMAHCYSHLFNLPTTGLRFFTVYGPYGRPDMALYLFIQAFYKKHKIKIFNKGMMYRDFTYVDDIANGVIGVLNKIPKKNKKYNHKVSQPSESSAPFQIFNIGNGKKIHLMQFVETLEKYLGANFKKQLLPMQMGDVKETLSDLKKINKLTGYESKTDVNMGILKFVNWYNEYFKKKNKI
jgi:UDP-glucuronate 4-epimerase